MHRHFEDSVSSGRLMFAGCTCQFSFCFSCKRAGPDSPTSTGFGACLGRSDISIKRWCRMHFFINRGLERKYVARLGFVLCCTHLRYLNYSITQFTGVLLFKVFVQWMPCKICKFVLLLHSAIRPRLRCSVSCSSLVFYRRRPHKSGQLPHWRFHLSDLKERSWFFNDRIRSNQRANHVLWSLHQKLLDPFWSGKPTS